MTTELSTTNAPHANPPFSLSRIHVLPEVLINQIAAGEVVERPASIIKELVENSLDADASRIEVRLSNGGLDTIQILDNGHGMEANDLALCLTRHATSKIQNAADLESIATFGFRGEALASIAAVSQIEIFSRTPEKVQGHQVEADFGLMKCAPKPVGCPVGTSITVRNLFERLPARLKFMRSPSTESSHCARVLKEIACGNPQAQFFLTNQDRKTLEFVSSTRGTRFSECFRPAWEPMHVKEENEEARLEAFLLPPHQVQDRGDIWFYVNSRAVRNRGLVAAVRQAYLSTLGPHHEPSGVVFLDIRPDWVDVNVHPQKTEVRCFRQESLFPWILSTIKKSIGAQRTVHRAPLHNSNSNVSPRSASLPPRYAAQPLLPDAEASFTLAETGATYTATPLTPEPPRLEPLKESPPSPDYSKPLPPESPPSATQPSLKYLGQIRASYLVCESPTGLVLVDQHALHEKVRTEELKRQFLAGDLAVQRLLLPKILPIAQDLVSIIDEHSAVLARLGFDLEVFGPREVLLRSRPELVEEEACSPIIEEILRQILAQGLKPEDVVNQSIHRLIATMACHSAIRANHLLTPREAESLLNRLGDLELGWTCPHGRPILFELSYQQIEHHFERA